ncbi:putative F-box protein PP2-B12 [Forsythia ovata]|uniref:F-box protein PP2-B12 n=1 Tax=Forsythia ovata TaxID=205694 RepID=A0ABD1PHD6_9LAMI
MSENYDNWERLVEAVLRREHDREIALAHSREPSFSSGSSSFISEPGSPIHYDQNIQLGSSSNTVNEAEWERLLLSDYEDIISRSVDPAAYATMKDLYSSLCDSPILLDRGNTVAKLKQVLRFDIRGQIESKILSPKTNYTAYLVFGFTKSYDGSLWSTYGSIGYVNNDKDVDAHKRARTLHLMPGRDKNGNIAVMRPDRWMEVKIGNFYTDQEYNSVLEARVWMNRGDLKSCLIVEGIEFRSIKILESGPAYPNATVRFNHVCVMSQIATPLTSVDHRLSLLTTSTCLN